MTPNPAEKALLALIELLAAINDGTVKAHTGDVEDILHRLDHMATLGDENP
jgi:hypothetical protein